MQEWEYRVEVDVTDLAPIGKDGWELVAVNDRGSSVTIYYFKRPLRRMKEARWATDTERAERQGDRTVIPTVD